MMGDLLSEIETTKRVQNNIEKFESLNLKESTPRNSTNSTNSRPKAGPVVEIDGDSEPIVSKAAGKDVEVPKKSIQGSKTISNAAPSNKRHDSTAFIHKLYLRDSPPPTFPDEAREILRSQPSVEEIEAVLAYLQCGIDGQHDFNVKITSPKSSQLVRILVTTTTLDLWPNLTMSKPAAGMDQVRATLLQSLFSVTGIEAILEQIRVHSRPGTGRSQEALRIYVDFLDHLLTGQDVVARLMHDCTALYLQEIQRRLFWQALISLLAGSKVLSTTTPILNALAESGASFVIPDRFINGSEYSKWLAHNIVKASLQVMPSDVPSWANLSQLLKRSLSLGYKERIASELYTSLLFGKSALWSPLHQLIKALPTHDQQTVFYCILDDLSRKHFYNLQSLSSGATDVSVSRIIAGAAALVHGLVQHNEHLLECAIDWLSVPSSASARNVVMRRALVASLAQSQGNLNRILERTMTTFADKLQLQHLATAQQEHLAQVILLVIGYTNRLKPTSLKQDPFPSLIMQSVSNRLASSIPRLRFLGMVVGVGMSRCVDEPGKVMDFGTEEMDTPEAKELLALTLIDDHVGSIADLKSANIVLPMKERGSKKRKIAARKSHNVKRPEPATKIMAVEEISSSSNDEDDLVPYTKPANDPEDSDEDPTLINREKPKPPIYIVDLIKQLSSSNDKPDVISLALSTAVPLVKRKAGFGTELSDNIQGLASALVNLRDGLSDSEQQQQRLDALIACLVAQPEPMGKYLTTVYFEGDFSLSQRSTVLIAIGMGARELAGYVDATSQTRPVTDLFPSERLPPHLLPNPLTDNDKSLKEQLALWNPVSTLSNIATMSTIKPMAEAAASSQTGPEILKIAKTTRTSSSLSVKSVKQSQKSKQIPKNVHSTLAKIYAALISPLTAILSYTLTSAGSRTQTSLLHPSILCLHLQTLTLILHTLGPTGLSSPSTFTSVANETLLLLSTFQNTRLVFDPAILPAHLGLFLALIDITVEMGITAQERLLGNDFGERVAELVRWVSGLETMPGVPAPTEQMGRGEGGVAWTVLAAGIQVRWYEIGKKFQGRMLGFDVAD